MRFLPLIIIVLSIAMFAGMAKADTAISACGDTLNTGYNYLTNDLNDTGAYGACLWIGYYQTLDCKGHTIDGNGSYQENAITFPFGYSAYSTVKNCIFKNFYQGVFGEQAGTETIENNTFYSLTFGAFLYLGDGSKVIGNRFYYTAWAAITLSGSLGNNNIIENNYFSSSNGYSIYLTPGATSQDNLIYNNYFESGASSIYLGSSTPNIWNVSNFIGQRIIGTGTLGGNFYGACSDLDCNGFCDIPVVFDGNNIDQLPLSNCIPPPPTPVSLMQKIDTSYICQGSSLITSTTYGYCGNNSCVTTVFNASTLCQFGCNNGESPNSCNPSPSQANSYFFLFVLVLLAVAVIVIYMLSKR